MTPLFSLTGQVVNVFTAPKVVKEDGTSYGGQDKVQILGDIPLQEGQTRKDIITLTTSQGAELQKAIGSTVVAPVGFYAKGSVISFFIPKGAAIQVRR